MKKIAAIISVVFLISLGLFLYFSNKPLITNSYDKITVKEMDGSEQIISDSKTIVTIVQEINQHPRRLSLLDSQFEDDSIKHSLIVFEKGNQHITMDYMPSNGILYYGPWKIHDINNLFNPLK
ncbi:hypothetical protein [Falsibacillus pallidus]|uniref:Uncharacterized protein n=1 Tax=Falsibacillus pallidus TaxID=493781 RepID=A0A370GPB3_9BACI|nr:hypothetical protein [Falsibacillus pallidus]RDI45517.1 hypothetical protein DFR59_102145 [Falsibacillus pallidus]